MVLNKLQTFTCNSTNQRVVAQQPLMGWLQSPLYPRPYPIQQNCLFEFKAEIQTGLVIHLTFIDVDLERRYSKSQQCLRDYLLLIITGKCFFK